MTKTVLKTAELETALGVRLSSLPPKIVIDNFRNRKHNYYATVSGIWQTSNNTTQVVEGRGIVLDSVPL